LIRRTVRREFIPPGDRHGDEGAAVFESVLQYVSENRSRAVWWALTAAVLLVVAVTVFSFIGTFVLGLFLYYAARPIHKRVDELVEGDTVSVLTTLVLFDLPFLAVSGYVLLVGARELRSLPTVTIEGVGSVLVGSPDRFERFLRDPVAYVTQFDNAVLQERLLTGAGILGEIATLVIHLVLAYAFAFFLLRDGDKLVHWARETVGNAADDGTGLDGSLWTYLQLVDRDLRVVYFGNIRTVFVVALLGVLVYNGLNAIAPAGLAVPVPTVLAVATGIATLIPLVVGKVVYLPVAGYLTLRAVELDSSLLWFPLAFAAVAFVVLDAFPITVVRPYLAGQTTHGGLMMFAYVLGGLMFGWYGLFLGPLLLVCSLNLFRVALGDLVHGEPVRAGAFSVDPQQGTRGGGAATGTPDEAD
jgi:predicted PurR-regulated permease PerM